MSSAAPKLGARASSARNSRSLSASSRLKKTDSIGPASRSTSLVKKPSKTKVKKEENTEESEFRKRLNAYRKNKNAHAPDMELKNNSTRPKSPRVASSSPALRRASSTSSNSSSKSPSRRPSTGRPTSGTRGRPKASPVSGGMRKKPIQSQKSVDVPPPPPPGDDDRQLAVSGFLHEQEPNFDQDGIQQTGLDVGKLTAMYDTINTRYGTKELKKRAFAVLIKQVKEMIGINFVPTETDSDTAFEQADIDFDGRVNLEEFVNFCVMIKRGELYKLDLDSISAIYTKSKYQTEKEAKLSKKTIKQRQMMSTSGDNVDQQGDDSRAKNEYHARDATSDTLANANDEWKKRTSKGNTTRAQEVGHYASHTQASRASHSSPRPSESQNLQGEASTFSQGYHGRGMTGEVLTNASDEYQKRIAKERVTQSQDLGHYASATSASRNSRSQPRPSNTGSVLANANNEWKKRTAKGNTTQSQELGHYATQTSSSQHAHDEVGHHSSRSQGFHGREMTGDVLANANNEWKKRVAKERVTQTMELGHYASQTSSSRQSRSVPREDRKSARSSVQMDRVDVEDTRDETNRQLAKAKAEFNKRMAANAAKGRTNTEFSQLGHYATHTVGSSHHGDKEDTVKAGRKGTEEELAKAKLDWEKRQKSNRLSTVTADLGHFAEATEANKHSHDLTNRGDAENISHMKLHGREQANAELSKAKADWEKRQKSNRLSTVTADLGHFAEANEASKHSHDKNNRGDAENMSHLRQHGRDEANAELAKAKLDWEKRQQKGRLSTVTADLGHFAEATEANKHSHDVNNRGDAESISHSKLHGRDESNAELAKAKADWEKRQQKGRLSTVAADLGHFAEATEANTHSHDVNNRGDAESISHSKLHGRDESNAELAKAKADWEKRQQKGRLSTVAADLGHFAEATEANKHSHDNNRGATESISHSKLHAREEANEELAKAKHDWEKRQQKGRLSTVAADMGHYADATEASTHSTKAEDHTITAKMLAQEDEQRLLDAKAQWEKRQAKGRLSTHAAELGHFATATEASSHSTKAEDHSISAKQQKMLDEQKMLDAKREWERRQAKGKLTTEAEELGHFATATESATHSNYKEKEVEEHAGDRANKEWRARQAKGKLTTAAEELGHFASATQASTNNKPGSNDNSPARSSEGRHTTPKKNRIGAGVTSLFGRKNTKEISDSSIPTSPINAGSHV